MNARQTGASRSPAVWPGGPRYRALQKQTLNANLRRRIVQDVPFGMALEGLTAADLPLPELAAHPTHAP